MSTSVVYVVLFAVVVGVVFVNGFPLLSADAADNHGIERRSPTGVLPATKLQNSTSNCNATAGDNTTKCDSRSSGDGFVQRMQDFVKMDMGVVYRALIVFGSISLIVLVYIGFRYFRTRQQRNKSRKYGLITMPGDKMELKPLEEDDDDDDDMTVFDRTKPNDTANSTKSRAGKTLKQQR